MEIRLERASLRLCFVPSNCVGLFFLQNDDFIGKVRKRTLFVYFPFAAPGQYLSFHRWDDTYLAAGISPVDQ